MTPQDYEYIQRLLASEVLHGRILELGANYGGATCRELISARGHSYFATDLANGPGIDFVADFEDASSVKQLAELPPFDGVLILNVLEHTFSPIAVLDNALTLLERDGVLAIITPAVWPLHHYPLDCCRLLPDWYRQYAHSRGLSLTEDWFEYLGFGPVSSFKGVGREPSLPRPGRSWARYWYSRILHRLWGTTGRGMFFSSHIAIGAVLERRPASC